MALGDQGADRRPALVRVAIPHYFNPQAKDQGGYGSTRLTGDALTLRGIALARCLGGVLGLNRGLDEQILHIDERKLIEAPPRAIHAGGLNGVLIDCHVFVTGHAWLKPVLDLFADRITIHQLDLQDPKRLPHQARDFLLEDSAAGQADLSVYLEDDLVIQDSLYVDKIIWFLTNTKHRFGLMPHRFELTGNLRQPRLFVDGPIESDCLPDHQKPSSSSATGRYQTQEIGFHMATNPHSGTFALSSVQRHVLKEQVRDDDWFVGPLETVATGTVLEHYPILKPRWVDRDFLLIEHAYPSFLYTRFSLA